LQETNELQDISPPDKTDFLLLTFGLVSEIIIR